MPSGDIELPDLKRFRKVKRRGYDAERELVEMLKNKNYWATRVPLSAVSVPLPDVIACKADAGFLGFQVKSTDQPRYYIARKYLTPLIEWKEAFQALAKARAFVAVKFIGRGRGWVFKEVFNDRPSWISFEG